MKKLTLLALAFFTVAAVNAQLATSLPQNQTVTLVLQNKIDIQLSGIPTGLNFTFDEAGDYATGLFNEDASEFRVRSNQQYNVSVAAGAAFFTGGAGDMPCAKLAIRLAGTTGSYIALSTGGHNIVSNHIRGSDVFGVDYKADPGYDFDAGTYTLTVVYTASQY